MAKSVGKNMKKSVAVVISNDHYNALGVVRSLGSSELYVVLALFSEGKTYVDKSKFVDETVVVSSYDDVFLCIKRTSAKFDKCFIFPLSDSSADYIDQNISSFPTNVYAPHMFGKMNYFQNKWNAKQLAKKIGMNVATDSVVALDEPDISWKIFPAIIKPIVSANGKKSDIQTIDSSEKFNEFLDVFRKKNYESVLVEEYLCGTKEHMIEVMGLSTLNDVFVAGVIRKVREYPFFNGSTSFAWVEKNSSEIDVYLVKKYIAETRFVGLFDMEFKYVDGKVYFIECNFRNGAPSYIFSRLKINLPLIWAKSVSAQSSKISCERKFSKCFFMCEQTDVFNMIKGKVGFFSWIIDFFRAKKIFCSFRDLRPLFSYLKIMGGIAFSKIRNR